MLCGSVDHMETRMKLEFDSPLNFTDGDVIPADIASTLAYTVFADTVSPPVQTFPVPAALVAAGTKNANGTVHVTIDLLKGDLTGFTPKPGATYFFAIKDSVKEGSQTVDSAESAIVTATAPALTPEAPGNFSIAS